MGQWKVASSQFSLGNRIGQRLRFSVPYFLFWRSCRGPPSTVSTWPVIKAPAGDRRKSTTGITSSTRPSRPRGVRRIICSRCWGDKLFDNSVSKYPAPPHSLECYADPTPGSSRLIPMSPVFVAL